MTRPGRVLPWVACAALIAGATAGDAVTASDVTFGGVEVLAVAWAAIVLGMRGALGLVAAAALGQAAGALAGVISVEAALLDTASVLAAALIGVVARRHGRVARLAAEAEPTAEATPLPAAAPADRVEAVAGIAAAELRARGLTERECEVARLALLGLTAAQIGARLYIGKRTVETHLARAYSKVGVRSRAEMAEVLLAAADRLGHGPGNGVVPTTAAVVAGPDGPAPLSSPR